MGHGVAFARVMAVVRSQQRSAQFLGDADELGVGTCKTMMTIDGVLNADEVFLTNSSWGVLPVIGVLVAVQTEEGGNSQNQSIGDGVVGTLTAQLHASYQETVDRETEVSVIA